MKCNNCGHEFEKPVQIESFKKGLIDVCPKCGNKDWREKKGFKDYEPEINRYVNKLKRKHFPLSPQKGKLH